MFILLFRQYETTEPRRVFAPRISIIREFIRKSRPAHWRIYDCSHRGGWSESSSPDAWQKFNAGRNTPYGPGVGIAYVDD